MPSPTVELHSPAKSQAPKIRLFLALLALVLSFVSVLRTQIVPLGDLYSRWYGTREFVLHGRNPYGDGVNREIQVAFYGHVLAAGEHLDEQRFAYPAYVLVLTWPMAFVTYATVSEVGLAVLAAAGVGVVVCTILLFGWPLHREDQISAVLIGMSSAPMLRALRVEQLSTLVVFFLMAALLALSKGRLLAAGIFLALATIKPQMALLPVIWLLLWTVAEWRQRKVLAISFSAAMSCLLLVSEIMVPGWLIGFPQQLHAYSGYAGHGSLLTILTGNLVGLMVTAAILVFIARIIWDNLSRGPGTRAFQFSSSLIMAAAAVVMPTMSAQHNLVMVFPAAFVVLREFASFTTGLRIIFTSLLAWTPAVGAIVLIDNVEPVRVLQMSGGVVMTGALLIYMVWFSSKLTNNGEPE